MKLKILHISDLHYTKGLRDNKVLNAFFKDIESIQIDFIFFTGDITFSGTKEDFILFTNEFYPKLTKVINGDKIIFCPGNHDVERSLIKKIIGKTITERINSKEELNEVVTGHKTHWYYTTNRLKHYYNFLGKISDNYKSIDSYSFTDFYTNYIYQLNGQKIGITSFNSCWLAQGGENDFGKLAIGQKNVDDAYKKIEECDIKFCLFHHPKEWYLPYDTSIDSIKKKYNFAFYGHNHEANPALHSTPQNNLVFSNTGCIHQSDYYFNGYTILEITNEKIEFNVRTYFPKREKFEKAIDLFENGKWIINRENLPVIDQEKVHFKGFQEQAIKSLITINDELKNFSERFVFPKLSKKSFIQKRTLTDSKDEDTIKKEELLEMSSNLVVFGKQESGKTCLLYYIGCETYKNEKKLSFYLNLELLVDKGADPLFREIRNIANDSDISDIEDKLDKGKCTILLDNFNEKEKGKNNKLNSFILKYPNNKYIVSINQKSLASFEPSKAPEIFKDFNSVYINSFEANNIRELVTIIKPEVLKEDLNLLVENICSLLSKTGLPYNPTMVSMLVDIQSQIGSFSPINKASLLDKLIEILLKKHDISNLSRGSFDYQNQVDLLSNFANLLYIKDSTFSIVKFEEFINSYLQQIGINDITSYSLIDLFIKSNIIVKVGENIEFKLKSFQQFFFAKYLYLYPEDIESIKKDHNYLKVAESIDYLTGLERKNQELLKFVLNELDLAFENAEFEYDLTKFDDTKISNGILTELMDDEVIEKIREESLPTSKKDEITQMRYPESCHDSSELDLLNPKEVFEKCLILSCNIIRNSELIKDIEFRENSINKVVNYWSRFLVEFILTINNNADSLEEMESKEEKEEFVKFINVLLPVAIQIEIFEKLGSSKLKTVLNNVITKFELNKIEKLLLILLLEDIDDSTTYAHLTKFLNDNSGSYYLKEVIFTFLMLQHETKPLSTSKRNKCLKIMSEIVAKKQGKGHKQIEEMVKKEFVAKYKKK